MPGHLIRRLHQVSVSLFMDEMAENEIDMTPVQFAALVAIGQTPAMDQATLASRIANDRATIGGVTDRLIQKKLVRREISPHDRRAKALYLTAQGEELYKHIAPKVKKVQDRILTGLNREEKKLFLALLQKSVDAVNDQSRAPLRLTT